MGSPDDAFLSGWLAGWAPEPDLTVSEWADEHRILSRVASSEPGRWRTSRTPYLREIQDTLSAKSEIEDLCFMKGAQIGGTEVGNNWVGYIIHQSPGPTLMVLPTVDVARRVSKQRLAPAIAATPALAAIVSEPRSRDSGNTTFMKEFPGGVLILTGANSSAGLKSMPIRNLFGDEVDEYPGEIEGFGDPIALARDRTSNFPKRKIYLCSTPGLKGFSRIEKAFMASDRRRFYVPCPHCGHMDFLTWSGPDWSKSVPGLHHRIVFDERDAQTTRMVCSSCAADVEERHKTEMLERGEWRPTAVGSAGARGYHLSALYSPLGWKSWAACVEEFLEAKSDPVRLRTWVNHVLGEAWEERGKSVDADSLLERAKNGTWQNDVPTGAGVLVAAVDVQDDRLEAAVWGFGAGEESWLVAHSMFHGDPGHAELWNELDRFLKEPFTHESGRSISIECTVVDSGGHHTDDVYRFCKLRQHRKIFAIRGGNTDTKEIVGLPSVKNRYRVKLFTVNVDTAKDVFYSRLRIREPGPGFIHLPSWITAEQVAQLTAEKSLVKYVRGRGQSRIWKKTRERNEQLDLAVYAIAAIGICGPALVRALPDRAARFASAGDTAAASAPTQPKQEAAPPAARPRRPSGWVDGWKS